MQKDNGVYGKFASADELYKAYRALEKEFTKRCMRLKAAETEIGRLNGELATVRERNEERSEDFARAAVEEYLLSVLTAAPAPSLTSSVGATALTPVKKPRSLAEAKELAKIFIENK